MKRSNFLKSLGAIIIAPKVLESMDFNKSKSDVSEVKGEKIVPTVEKLKAKWMPPSEDMIVCNTSEISSLGLKYQEYLKDKMLLNGNLKLTDTPAFLFKCGHVESKTITIPLVTRTRKLPFTYQNQPFKYLFHNITEYLLKRMHKDMVVHVYDLNMTPYIYNPNNFDTYKNILIRISEYDLRKDEFYIDGLTLYGENNTKLYVKDYKDEVIYNHKKGIKK